MQTNFDSKRRRTLGVLGATALSSLGGCCALAPFPRNAINQEPLAASLVRPILRPIPTSRPSKPAGLKYSLDVHSHFFNASDVNVQGYVEGPIAHGIDSPLLREFVKLLAPVLEELAYLAPTADREYTFLTDWMNRPSALGLRAEQEGLDQVARQHLDVVSHEVFQAMQRRNLGPQFLRLRALQQAQTLRLATVQEQGQFTEEMVRESIDPVRRQQSHLQLYGTEVPPAESTDPGGPLEFLGHMLSYRWMNLRTFQKFYTEADGAFGIDGAFGALVDFDHWLCPPSLSSREDQVKLHCLLSRASGGYMLPIAAYNPWTDIKNKGASLQLVQDAIQKYGFVGVKIYPPMGYFPWGNEQIPVDTHRSRPSLHELDAALETMFTWCAKNNVPVMAHTTQSMGRDDASDVFGGPAGWNALFDRFKGKTPPIVQAGHFGGAKQKPDTAENWSAEFAKRAGMPGGERFYGDLGYWDSLMWCDADHPDCQAVRARLDAALKAGDHVKDRIMYGTDWFMTSIISDWASYPRRLFENLQGRLPAPKFFYSNAIACYGLGVGGAQRERVVASLDKIPGGVPAWLRDV